MSKIIKLRKGLDINLQGKAAESLVEVPMAGEYAVSPLDFEGVIPKLLVKAGDKVKAGTPLFFDKKDSRVLFTSPVSGTVSAVNRGEKRKVLNVTVAADATQEYETFPTLDLRKANRSEVIEVLLKSGLWTMIRQRPYGIIANPDDAPKSIFVSAFDSAPLAPDMNFVLRGEKDAVQKGLEVLGKLTDGKVHLSMRAKAEGDMASMKGVELHSFEGKHPVGNVGVQIHHIDPIAKGDIVWTAGIQDVVAIGRLFLGGKVDPPRRACSSATRPLTCCSARGRPSCRAGLPSSRGRCSVWPLASGYTRMRPAGRRPRQSWKSTLNRPPAPGLLSRRWAARSLHGRPFAMPWSLGSSIPCVLRRYTCRR